MRTKYIHSVGVVGKCKFQSNGNHAYTGVFQGFDHGLCRLSSAAQPSSSQPLAPGISLKVLRNGQESADVVALFSVNGTPGNWNFFSHDFYNHIAAATGTALKALAYKFSTFTDYIQEVGLSNMGAYDQNGNAAGSNNFPFKLRFHPHASVQNLFPAQLQGGNYMGYLDQLKSVPANSNIYDVYALNKPVPLGGTETLIGTISLDGTFTTTMWGDRNLFFKHQIITDDMNLKPEWKPYYASYKLGGKCPY